MPTKRVAAIALVLVLGACRGAGADATSDPTGVQSAAASGTAAPTPSPSPTPTAVVVSPSPSASPGASEDGGCAPPDDPFAAGEGESEPEPPRESFYDHVDFEPLQAYGEEQADTFGGLWIDWETETVTLSFTADLERHRAALRELAPDAPIRVIQARHTEREMHQLLSEMVADDAFHESIQFEFYNAGFDVIAGFVHIEGAACRPDEAAAAFLERYGKDRVRPEIHPLPGEEPPQPQEGEGWRLLLELPQRGEMFTVDYADTEGSYRQLADRLALDDPPAIDFERELVVALMTSGGAGGGHPCDWVHLLRITLDRDERLVTAEIRHPRPPGVGCDTVGIPHTLLVALDRAEMPEPPYTVVMHEPGIPSDEVVVGP